MNGDGRPARRRRRRKEAACDGSGAGRGRRSGAGRGTGSGRGDRSLGERTATRALIAAGTYVAQDLRDAEGLTRPLLRRAALRLAVCPSEPIRRLGGAYLRFDPPAPGEIAQRAPAIDVSAEAPASRALPAPPGLEEPAAGEDPAQGGGPDAGEEPPRGEEPLL